MLKASSLLLDHAAREMEDYIDQRSEQWQESEPGESLAQMLESAQDASAIIEDALHQNRQLKPDIT
jgi:adenosyl cobinamide kinase/adenosyl cobinamide phosphate guanylyltransferase